MSAMPKHPIAAAATLALLAALGACNSKPDTDALDNELVNGIAANDVDPALADALGNQIVVDPARAGAKPKPGTLGARAAAGAKGSSASLPGSNCNFRYDAAWAGKLPAELPLYPGARLGEAAGSDAAGCRRRIVSFASSAPPATIVEFYRARVTKAGYSVEHLVQPGSDVLGGTRGDAAYYVTVTPAKGGGSAVDLVANTGG